MSVLLLPHSLPVQLTTISQWQNWVVKLIAHCYHPIPSCNSHTLSHTKTTSSYSHSIIQHSSFSSSSTLASSFPALHSAIQSFNSPMTKLSRIYSLWHYHSFHTDTASLTNASSCPPLSIPSCTSITSLPASYTTLGSVYIHWPYCQQRCSYCNFVKFVPYPGARWTLPHDVLEDAIVSEYRIRLFLTNFHNGSDIARSKQSGIEFCLAILYLRKRETSYYFWVLYIKNNMLLLIRYV